MSFNIDFNILDYKAQGILPSLQEYEKRDVVLNIEEYRKGNIENCYWKKQVIDPLRIDREFKEREIRRILDTGVWMCLKETMVWLPPPYYFALQYGRAGDENLEFRLKRLKQLYFKILARKNPKVLGTYTIKNRQDGETTMAITEAFWETFGMTMGQIGIQSKTRADAFNPCWRTMQMLWQGLPKWLKDDLCPDFASGDNIAQKMQFMSDSTDTREGRNILLEYFPSVHNAMDGRNNMRRCILDEINKWKECSFIDTFTNYKKFIMVGAQRRGLFDIFSSPADVDGKWNDEAYSFWQGSNPDEVTKTGTTATRILRYYSNPLEGIQGFYDKYGDANPDEIYDFIMAERENVKKTKPDKLQGEIRAFPLNEEEMFGSFDSNSVWSNSEGIKNRKIFLLNRRFKDDETKEPVKIYGNFEREDGYIDGDVVWRPADADQFDLDKARFCVSYLPQNKEELKSVYVPPRYSEYCLGVDPINKKNVKTVKRSDAAMVCWKFRDLYETGVNKCPVLLYSCRPQHPQTFYEDVLRAAIFFRARIQYEANTVGLEEYIEDRGYKAWLLPSKGEKEGSKFTGDSVTGKGSFLQEGRALLDAVLNTPLTPEDPYLLERVWFLDLLDDVSKFNPIDTHKNDKSMAWIQSLVGSVKMMHLKIKKNTGISQGILDYMLR